MRDLHAGCWGSLHTMERLVLPTCDTACFWTGYLVLTASDLQENWNPVLNLYENSEFVKLGWLHPLQGVFRTLRPSNGHSGMSLRIACEDA